MSSNKKPCLESHEEVAARTAASLGSVVGTFAARLQRKLKAQESADERARLERELRHNRLLQAMISVRRALQDNLRINLGQRFSLELSVSDHEGWPRFELNLLDALQPERVEYGLIVTANDRNDSGAITFTDKASATPVGHISVRTEEDYRRLPTSLKAIIRKFLDSLAPFVISPKSERELAREKPIELHEDPVSKSLQNADLFVEEEILPDANRVTE